MNRKFRFPHDLDPRTDPDDKDELFSSRFSVVCVFLGGSGRRGESAFRRECLLESGQDPGGVVEIRASRRRMKYSEIGYIAVQRKEGETSDSRLEHKRTKRFHL